LSIVGCGPVVSVSLVFMSGGSLPSLDTAASRATGSGWGVALGEPHAHGRHAFYVRCPEIVATGAWIVRDDLQGRTHLALVIGENDYEVGFIGRFSGETADQQNS